MALTFNGSTSKLVGSPLISGYPFTMFCWIRPNLLTADQMVMGVGDMGGATEAMMFAAGSGSNRQPRAFSRAADGTNAIAAAGTNLALSTWQPCMVLFRNDSYRLVNFVGQTFSSNTTSKALTFANFDRFVIGVRGISDTMFANMDVAYAALWAGELYQDDWHQLRHGADPSTVRPEILVDMWSLATTGATQTGSKGNVLTATSTSTAATSPTVPANPPTTEPDRIDGVWTWFSEPRARVYNGNLYEGYIDRLGTPGVTKLDLTTNYRREFPLDPNLTVNDHSNAVPYIRQDGRIIMFYTNHSGTEGLLFKKSTNPEDIGSWGSRQEIDSNVGYANPRYLSGNSRLYCHYRKNTQSSFLIYSDDDGDTWSSPQEIFKNGTERPYVKSITNGVDRIDFYLTNCHPNEAVASVYHCMAKLVSGVLRYYKSDGTTELTTFPILPSDCSLVYDAAANSNTSGWQWDMRYGSDGHPRMLFQRRAGTNDIRYMFARWTGSAWTTPVQIAAGGAAMYSGEPNYGHGLCWINDNAAALAIESGGKSDLERWETSDNGATWAKASDITSGTTSPTKNFRPFMPWGSTDAILAPRGSYSSFTNYNTDIYRYNVASATNYPVTTTESATASDSASVVIGFARSLIEAALAADTVSVVASLSGSVMEAGSATDAQDAVRASSHTVTESGSATDAQDGAVGGGGLNATVTESGNAQDALAAVLARFATVTEAATAADTAAVVTSRTGVVTESGAAIDIVDATGSGDYSGTVNETANAQDEEAAAVARFGTVTETGNAQDTVDGTAISEFSASISEAANAQDTISVTRELFASVVEALSATDQAIPARALFLAVIEAADARDRVRIEGEGISGVWVKDAGVYVTAEAVWVKRAGVYVEVVAVWVKQNGSYEPL